MDLRTEARDCLYVNWAVPAAAAPPLPATLRYEEHPWQGSEWVFTTALFFRFVGLRSRRLPLVRLSYPQMSLRLYVIDGEGVPSVLFVRMVVPRWVAPVARLIGRQPAFGGSFAYPPSSGVTPAEETTWSLERRGRLEVRCRPGAPACGPGPNLGDWRRTVDYVRRRERGYVLSGTGVRSILRQQPRIEAVPMSAEIRRSELLAETFSGVEADHWSRPHSAWLCPQIPVVFELGKPLLPALPSATGQMATVTDSC